MAAPKGNQFALGNKGGRQRTVSFEPEEMIKLGEEMLQWVEENNPIHLSMWYCIHKGFTYKQWDTFQQKEEFLPYYEAALKLVGYNYLSKNSDVEPSLKQRWQRVYFKDLREQEDADLDAQAIRNKDVEGSKKTTYQIVVPHDLAIGSDIPTQTLPTIDSKGAK